MLLPAFASLRTDKLAQKKVANLPTVALAKVGKSAAGLAPPKRLREGEGRRSNAEILRAYVQTCLPAGRRPGFGFLSIHVLIAGSLYCVLSADTEGAAVPLIFPESRKFIRLLRNKALEDF